MARARNIKPGFCTNEDLAECSFEARLCFALLPMLADREGRLEDRPKRIKGELFRFDSLDVEPLLAELEAYGFIARYEVNGLRLIQILAFGKHQNPHHREPESTLPTHPSLRLDPDGKYVKPEADAPLDAPKASDKPEASPRLSPPRDDLARGSSRADSGSLIPDPGTLIPDPGSSEPAALSAPPTPSTKAELWMAGKSLLSNAGMPEKQCGTFVGKLAKDYGDDVVVEAVRRAVVEQPADPASFLKATCQAAAGQRRTGRPFAHRATDQRDYEEGFDVIPTN